jgi:hypothetical protein
VNDLLHKLKLIGRITSITTDNASNNGMLLMEINQYLEEALAKGFLDGNIQYIPCLPHVIQLGLKALLGKIRITSKKKKTMCLLRIGRQIKSYQSLPRSNR